jgi:hypothetical protein
LLVAKAGAAEAAAVVASNARAARPAAMSLLLKAIVDLLCLLGT